jgi:hypothetical protein
MNRDAVVFLGQNNYEAQNPFVTRPNMRVDTGYANSAANINGKTPSVSPAGPLTPRSERTASQKASMAIKDEAEEDGVGEYLEGFKDENERLNYDREQRLLAQLEGETDESVYGEEYEM